VFDITDASALNEFAARLHDFDRTMFARIAIQADDPPRVLPSRDGVFLKNRFRQALGWNDPHPPDPSGRVPPLPQCGRG